MEVIEMAGNINQKCQI